MKNELPLAERDAISVPEAAQLMHVSKSTMYEWVKIPGFPAMKVKHKIIVSKPRLQKWFNDRIDAGGLDW